MSGNLERILDHMNKSHKLSLYDYLAHYGDVYVANVVSVKMTDLKLDSLSIEYTTRNNKETRTKSIPIDPPMQSLADARTTLKDMAKESAKARGFSASQIKEFIMPNTGGEFASWLFVGSLVLFGIAPSLFLEPARSFIGDSLCQTLYRLRLFPMTTAFAIHVGESLFLLKPVLDKFRVTQPARIKWVLCHLIEGYPAIKRLRAEGWRLEN